MIRIGFNALSRSVVAASLALVSANAANLVLGCDHVLAAELSRPALPKEFPVKTRQPAMEKVKELAGSWVGKDEDGQESLLTYVVTSGGTSVLETLTAGVHPPMLTVYHEDGDSVMATHYCNMNNQPRMRLKDFDATAGKMFFDFVDITNLKSPESGHIRDLTLNMPDKNHLVQEWTYTDNGKRSQAIFKFERKTGDSKKTLQK